MISVIMGVYREKPEYIRLSIESILQQTYTDFEFIIVLDDPDNIEALQLLKEYEKSDNRIIVLVNDKNIGLAMSLNRAMGIARGKYLARMDADDISLPTRFRRQVEVMESHKEISVLGTNKNIMNESGEIVSKGGHLPTTADDTKKVLKYENIIVHPSVLMRTEDIKTIDGYRDFPTTQDLDLWLRVLTSGMNICNIDEFLINYRINSQGISMSKAYRQTLIGAYIRALEKERLDTGKDSYSKQNLEKYLKDNNADDPKAAEKYQVARAVFEEGRLELKNRHFISGAGKLMKAASMHPLMKKQVKRTLLSSIIKRSTK
jgi:glycosyltransferase involved in cell wall biosynthesis